MSNINSRDIAESIQTTYQATTHIHRHEDGWDGSALARLPWHELPEAVKNHFEQAVQAVLSDRLPKIRSDAIEAYRASQQ